MEHKLRTKNGKKKRCIPNFNLLIFFFIIIINVGVWVSLRAP
jgi:predicted nucleic acid-binding Zn ribbon protein